VVEDAPYAEYGRMAMEGEPLTSLDEWVNLLRFRIDRRINEDDILKFLERKGYIRDGHGFVEGSFWSYTVYSVQKKGATFLTDRKVYSRKYKNLTWQLFAKPRGLVHLTALMIEHYKWDAPEGMKVKKFARIISEDNLPAVVDVEQQMLLARDEALLEYLTS
jgi:hypothetical protein